MSNSGGKITAPVSIEDVRTVLGVSSYDLGTLCKNTHGKIRILSISKPTDKTGWNPSDPQTGEMDDLWYRGIKCYGILKPYNNASSFKVSISLNYWYKTNRIMTGIFTVNTASVQNSYTVNLT